MSDVRALLKAKRQEARINHPLASYTSDSILRCIICSTAIKHASAWQGHLGSKAHRLNVARVKQEEERRMAELEEQERMEEEEEERAGEKRKMEEEEEDNERLTAKKQKMDVDESPSSRHLPAGFFSDPTRAPTLDDDDDDENENEDSAPPAPVAHSALDEEYLAFEREIVNAPDYQEVYQNATVLAEPELASEIPEGFPPDQRSELDTATKEIVNEEELRRRKELEERELIMDRLFEEERAQEEADMKVVAMKAKLEAFKKRRRIGKSSKEDASH